MGSSPSHHNDTNVRIFTTFNRRVYSAGQLVEGVTHIDCLSARPYQILQIKVVGKQSVQWIRGSGQSASSYEANRTTYNSQFPLARFQKGIRAGHYSFPFSFLLPYALPASFSMNERNYIKYHIEAWLTLFDQKVQPQMMFPKQLHVREPPRGIVQNSKGKGTGRTSCCCCFCSGGSGPSMLLEANVSYLQSNGHFRVRGSINNSEGSTIYNYQVVLRQKIKNVGSKMLCGTKGTCIFRQDFVLYMAKKIIPSGGSEQFEVDISLPSKLVGYTAIGSILSRAYFLCLTLKSGCCCKNPSIEVPTVLINSIEPPANSSEEETPPKGWNPLVAPPVQIQLPPYVYAPEQQIQIRNQAGSAVIPHHEMMARMYSGELHQS